jgi:hypothetical protein
VTATNHVLTGAVIALVIKQPAAALPLAVASHFVLDSLPHFGNHPKVPHTSTAFLYILASDAGMAAAVLLTLFVVLPGHGLLAIACGILAASPDLMWFPNFVREVTGRKLKKPDPITRWHKRIQRYELPWGMYIEALWFVIFVPILLNLMSRP